MKSFIKFIIYSLILLILVNLIYFKFINKSSINHLFGYSFFKVVTGSMEPEIQAGENIIIKKCDEYKIGDIITYIANDGNLVTHRIISIIDGVYHTKGDFNNTEDMEPVSNNQIYGKVIFHFHSFLPNSFLTYSKHINSKKTSINSKIAKPIFIVDGDKEILIDKYNRINDYNFSIRNYKDDVINDVTFEYKIEVIADDAIEYQLFCDNNLVNIADTFIMPHTNSIEHKYLLKIQAPEDCKGTVKINVHAYQKEEKS